MSPSESTPPIILVLGVTGVGKSTFISCAGCKDGPEVNNSLVSSQVEPKGFQVVSRDGKKTVILVDTPGFNDTERPDTVILETIKSFVETEKRPVTGVIYLVDTTILEYKPVKMNEFPVPPPVVVASAHGSHAGEPRVPPEKLKARYKSAYHGDHFGSDPEGRQQAAWKIIQRVLDTKGAAASAQDVRRNLDLILQDRLQKAGKNKNQRWYHKIIRLFKFM